MNRSKAENVFKDVVEKSKKPEPLGEKYSHEFLHERFARVIVRDALLELGVKMKDAEKAATENVGTPRKRFWKCVYSLKLVYR